MEPHVCLIARQLTRPTNEHTDTALSCACYARLIIDGKDHGVQIFMVTLRRREDYSLLPGVTTGDCGAKMVRS